MSEGKATWITPSSRLLLASTMCSLSSFSSWWRCKLLSKVTWCHLCITSRSSILTTFTSVFHNFAELPSPTPTLSAGAVNSEYPLSNCVAAENIFNFSPHISLKEIYARKKHFIVAFLLFLRALKSEITKRDVFKFFADYSPFSCTLHRSALWLDLLEILLCANVW